jgi:MFS family permease
VAAAAFALFVVRERRSPEPIIDRALFRGRNLRAAMMVNFLVGGALVIAMVQVPLWINVIELDTGRSAVRAAEVLTGLTAAMAAASYAGGHLSARWWYRPPILAGLMAGLAGFAVMGTVWEPSTSYLTMAATLALVGAGLGLVIAPTSAAVVDHAPPGQRGAAAGLVMLFRLMGLSVGLSSLTAWGLHRFNTLRQGVELPPLTDPGFTAAVQEAQASITTAAIGEMFAATTVVMALALAVALTMRRPQPEPATT